MDMDGLKERVKCVLAYLMLETIWLGFHLCGIGHARGSWGRFDFLGKALAPSLNTLQAFNLLLARDGSLAVLGRSGSRKYCG
jgi:hypothetical protein